MTFRTLVILCLAAVADGIMTKGASEGSLPSKRSAARHRAAKGSDSGGVWGIVADAVEGAVEGLADALEEADEADEMEMHKTSLDVDNDDEEDEEDMLTPAERTQALSTFVRFYGEEKREEIADIIDRGTAPDASDEDVKKAEEFIEKTAEKTAELGKADEAPEMEMHKTSLDVDKDDEEDEEDEEDMTPAELRAASALEDFYGKERLKELAGIVDRGMASDASEDDHERAKEYMDKMSEIVGAADASDATEMHKTSLDMDKDDEEDEDDEEDMTPAELRAASALEDHYGKERLQKLAGIVDRGMASDASEDDHERAKEYMDEMSEIVGAADASDATEMHQTSFDEARADREADEIVEHVAHGVGTIVDAVAPLATELLDAVLGDDEDEA